MILYLQTLSPDTIHFGIILLIPALVLVFAMIAYGTLRR